MTIEERDTARAIQSMNRKMKDETKIDWENRRYEIAKDILTQNFQFWVEGGLDEDIPFTDIVKCAIGVADDLIEELKNNPIK